MAQAESTCTITGVVNGTEQTLTLVLQSLTHGMDKQLIIIPVANKGNSNTLTYLVDLQRCKEAVNIVGFIVDQSGGLAEDKDNVLTPIGQNRLLIDFMRNQNGTLTLRWGSNVDGSGNDTSNYETMVGSIQKADSKELPGKLENYNNALTNKAWHKFYSIQLVFVRGELK